MSDNSLLNKLTIAIPVYNDEKYIAGAIQSCIGQAGKIIIYDNCSTDGTSDICAEFEKKHKEVTHIRHDKNLGAFENFRRPLFECDTEYFQWVGSHDKLSDQFTLGLLRDMEKSPDTVLATGNIVPIDENDVPASRQMKGLEYNKAEMMHDDPLIRMLSLINKFSNCFIIYNIFRTEYAQKAWYAPPCIGYDDGFLLNISALGKISHNPEYIFYARDLSITRKQTNTRIRQAKEIVGERQKPLDLDLRSMTMQMLKTVADKIKGQEDIVKAFNVLEAIYVRYHEPKKDRRRKRFIRRMNIAVYAVLAVCLIFIAASFIIPRLL